MKVVSLLMAAALISALYSCGGGGSDEEVTQPTPDVMCQEKPEVCR